MKRSNLTDFTFKAARRIIVAAVGGTLMIVGLILVFTPGPAIVVLLLGLAVLAAEFAWARRWLRKLKSAAEDTAKRMRGDTSEQEGASGERAEPAEPAEPSRRS